MAHFGQAATIVNAFAFIGFDLTSRDALHEEWRGEWLWPKMAALIAAGSALSWILNANAGKIALASLASFALAGAADAIAYHVLVNMRRTRRMNTSNVVSAAVDSIMFPALAFGWPPALWICSGQFIAKTAGGAMWCWIIDRISKK